MRKPVRDCCRIRLVVIVVACALSGARAFAEPIPEAISCSISQATSGGSPSALWPSISGGGTAVAFRSAAGTDVSPGVFLLDVLTGGLRQLTADDPPGPPNLFLAIDDGGTRVAFASNLDLTGDNADRNLEIFLADTATGIGQVTRTTGLANITPALSGDGSRIAFVSVTGPTSSGEAEIRVFDLSMNIFTRAALLASLDGIGALAFSRNGNRIAFNEAEDLTGENPDGNREVFLFDVTTGVLRQVTHTVTHDNGRPVLNGDGNRIVFSSTADPAGENADHNTDVFVADLVNNVITQVTRTTGEGIVAISSDAAAARIVVTSRADLTGENPDTNTETFLIEAATGGVTQLTFTTGPAEVEPDPPPSARVVRESRCSPTVT